MLRDSLRIPLCHTNSLLATEVSLVLLSHLGWGLEQSQCWGCQGLKTPPVGMLLPGKAFLQSSVTQPEAAPRGGRPRQCELLQLG